MKINILGAEYTITKTHDDPRMAVKQFDLKDECDKQKMHILLNAYVSAYVASCFPLGGLL